MTPLALAETPPPQFQVINITGRLCADPELRHLPNGDPVCRIRLAVDGMAAKRETGYIDVTAFGKPGEAAARVLTKGWLVAVQGRLDYRTWKTDDGQSRSAHQVVGSIEFLAAPKGNGNGDQPAAHFGPAGQALADDADIPF